jgi:hypothetical protein
LPSGLDQAIAFWAELGPYLSNANLSNTIGIHNSTLYDVLDDNNGTRHVAVGAKSFNATCGSITNTIVVGTPTKKPTTWQVIINYNGYESTLSLN